MQIHNLFPTQVGEYQVNDEDLLATLRNHLDHERIVNYEEQPYSIRGKTSHHTRNDLASLDCEWSKKLRALIVKVANEWYTEVYGRPLPEDQVEVMCWGMIMSEGDYSQVHSHPGSDACGVLWLHNPPEHDGDGGSPREGNLVLMDPVHCRRSTHPAYVHVDVPPKVGYGLVFHNWLEHYVEPFFGEGDRFSIAWNVTRR